ncbi:MAG: hypothetical protein L6264_10465 [Weeksellaceae bacterium]|nr:hypothetical protein [Bacteroidota bacterium]MCG2781364.1 hypothetical protein [Weeksellaceae bacterium]
MIINKLIDVLFEYEYFGYRSSAVSYTDKIYAFIAENIDKPIVRFTPPSHQKYGKKYLKYKANPQTTWYIFFDQKEGKYLVNHILNNHSKDFPELL